MGGWRIMCIGWGRVHCTSLLLSCSCCHPSRGILQTAVAAARPSAPPSHAPLPLPCLQVEALQAQLAEERRFLDSFN